MKVGYKGVFITWTCSPDASSKGYFTASKGSCYYILFNLIYVLQIEILKTNLAGAAKMLERSQKEAMFHIKNLEGFIKK